MGQFRDFLNEDSDVAKEIRKILKDKFGLSSRDVSVRSSIAGYSSSINIKLKTIKSLAYTKKIESLSGELESYETENGTGEILSGGNTFIFVEMDYKFRTNLEDDIQKEFEKQLSGRIFDENTTVVLYGAFMISKRHNTYYVTPKSSNNPFVEMQDIDYVGSSILQLIKKSNNDSLYLKLK
jgi:hypothetical protein